jgi:hypothetical protein
MSDKADAAADKLVMATFELERVALALRLCGQNQEHAEPAARRAEYSAKEIRRFLVRNFEWASNMEPA